MKDNKNLLLLKKCRITRTSPAFFFDKNLDKRKFLLPLHVSWRNGAVCGLIVQWIEQVFPKELMRFDGYNIEIVKIGRQLE